MQIIPSQPQPGYQPQYVFDEPAPDAVIAALASLYEGFRNPQGFIPNSLKVQSRQGQLVPFNLKQAQIRFCMQVDKQRAAGRPVRQIVGKGRRIGMSAIIAGLIFHATPFDEGQSALILAHQKKAARNLYGYYHRFEQNYTPYLGIGLPQVTGRSASVDSGSIRWANRSSIEIATAGNLDFSRSFDFRFLHMSEYGYYPNIRGLMTALIATVADDPGTMIFKETTANGYNDFHSDCMEAMEGKSDYEFFFAGCFEDEENWRSLERDGVDPVKFEASLTDHEWALVEAHDLVLEQIYWWRKKLQDFKGDLKRIQQEYPETWQVMFQSSGNQRFSPSLFTWMPTDAAFERGELRREEVNRKEVLRFRPHQYGTLTVWKPFKRGSQYIGGADPSKGVDVNATGGGDLNNKGTPDPDYSAAVVGERALGEQILELRDRLEPIAFAQYLYDLGHWCFQETDDWIYWVVEVGFDGGNGLAVCREMMRLGYPLDRMYFSEGLTTATKQPKKEIGFVIRPNTRPLLISNHELYLLNGGVTLHSKMSVSEHLTFVKKQKGLTVRIEHEVGCHDDLCFACMYMTWGFQNAPVFSAPKRDGQAMPTKYGQQGLTEENKRRIRDEMRRRNSIKNSRGQG